ncbi:MAG: Alpha/Beta hydrolase protein [Monoraphidium minutum]|nr:MAG: Alpha/Beta hydrolase protein [Monoraphidium minutum]
MESASYCTDLASLRAWNCSRCGHTPGFVTELAHFDAAWDLAGYAGWLPSLGAKVIVFKGTDSSSWSNWLNNMRTWRTDARYPVPGAPKGLLIHSGFDVLWNSSSMAAAFLAAYATLHARHPRAPTYVAGHSMGAALAHLCALDLRARFDPPELRVVTFGSPRVGNAAFAEFFDAHVAESWRFTHGRDIVPSLPPALMGFRHVSREVWVVDVDAPPGGGGGRRVGAGGGGGGGALSEERLIVCDDSGEDPTCHASVCHLGLCTSVADHLTYLGAPMMADGTC